MAIARRQATTVWTGSVARGEGAITMGSSAATGPLPISLPTRTSSPEDETSPEELIAAAHSGCYAMALASVLSQSGTPPERLEVAAEVTLDHVGEGFGITTSKLTVSGDVPGLDEADFRAAATTAEGFCPVSNALRATVDVSLDAALLSAR